MPSGIYKRTPENLKNMSISHKGKIPWNKGKKGIYSEESIEKMRKAGYGRTHTLSPDECLKISLKFKGKPKSELAKQRMRENHADFKGSKHPRWKGGVRRRSDGYVSIYSPKHPFRSTTGTVLEHRLVMEKHLGRYLTQKEVVHHKNGIKNDNRIENLAVMSAADHCRLHKGNNQRLVKHKEIL